MTAQDGSNKKEDEDPRLDRPAGESPARQPGEGVEQGDLIGEGERQGHEASVPVVPDDNSLSTFTQRLLESQISKKHTCIGTDCVIDQGLSCINLILSV